MKKIVLALLLAVISVGNAWAQMEKPYNEEIDPLAQIEQAVKEAQQTGKYVVCQVGGNWCPWCLKFNKFIHEDAEIAKLVSDNYVYIHVNWPRRGGSVELQKRLNNFARFGFPVMVVLNSEGTPIHLQDSSFLEEGSGYNKEKTQRFFTNWTKAAVESLK